MQVGIIFVYAYRGFIWLIEYPVKKIKQLQFCHLLIFFFLHIFVEIHATFFQESLIQSSKEQHLFKKT